MAGADEGGGKGSADVAGSDDGDLHGWLILRSGDGRLVWPVRVVRVR
jgi:hypothetical protein